MLQFNAFEVNHRWCEVHGRIAFGNRVLQRLSIVDKVVAAVQITHTDQALVVFTSAAEREVLSAIEGVRLDESFANLVSRCSKLVQELSREQRRVRSVHECQSEHVLLVVVEVGRRLEQRVDIAHVHGPRVHEILVARLLESLQLELNAHKVDLHRVGALFERHRFLFDYFLEGARRSKDVGDRARCA